MVCVKSVSEIVSAETGNLVKTRVCVDTRPIQKGWSKVKALPQKPSSKVKAPFGFTRNRYPDVLYYRPTSVLFRPAVGRIAGSNRDTRGPVEASLSLSRMNRRLSLWSALWSRLEGRFDCFHYGVVVVEL